MKQNLLKYLPISSRFCQFSDCLSWKIVKLSRFVPILGHFLVCPDFNLAWVKGLSWAWQTFWRLFFLQKYTFYSTEPKKIWGRSDQWLQRYSTFNILRSSSIWGYLHLYFQIGHTLYGRSQELTAQSVCFWHLQIWGNVWNVLEGSRTMFRSGVCNQVIKTEL